MRHLLHLLRRGLRLGLAVFAVTVVAVRATEWHLARTAGAEALAAPVDVAIVLGAGVEGDGRLAYDSRRRVIGAAALLEAGQVRRLIFSGGLGGNHPETPAGRLMRDHALALGAAPEALAVEPHARTTFENLRFAFAMADAMGAERIALVSDPHHLARSAALARFWGRPDVALVAVEGIETVWWPLRAVYLGREALAWWLNLGKVAAWQGLGLLGLSPAERAEWVR